MGEAWLTMRQVSCRTRAHKSRTKTCMIVHKAECEDSMALWCSNVLTVSGPEDELVRFLEQAPTVRQAISGSDWVDYTEALDFENFVPGANDQIGKSGALNSRLSEREPGRAVFTFETPYSAPVEVYARLAECFPLLVFHCEFVGRRRTAGADSTRPMAATPSNTTMYGLNFLLSAPSLQHRNPA